MASGCSLREGQVYSVESCYGETDENHGVGPAEKKMLLVSTKQEIRTKNCTLLLYHIELLTNLI